jgi:hypothetical protein
MSSDHSKDTASFQSIFGSTSKDADPALSKLFGRKSAIEQKTAIAAVVDLDTDDDDVEETKAITQNSKEKKSKKKFDAEVESRTVFVGNVDCSSKKEVSFGFQSRTVSHIA